MYIPMSGPTSPVFPVPTWVLVSEALLWEHGLPYAVTLVETPAVQANGPGMATFACREDAELFLEDNSGADAPRPLLLGDVMLVVAVMLNRMKHGGMRHVILFRSGPTGLGAWPCDAGQLAERLAAAAQDE